jgi:hypothetical protein
LTAWRQKRNLNGKEEVAGGGDDSGETCSLSLHSG